MANKYITRKNQENSEGYFAILDLTSNVDHVVTSKVKPMQFTKTKNR